MYVTLIESSYEADSFKRVNPRGKNPGLAGGKTGACHTLLHLGSPHHRQGEYRGSKMDLPTIVFDKSITPINVTLLPSPTVDFYGQRSVPHPIRARSMSGSGKRTCPVARDQLDSVYNINADGGLRFHRLFVPRLDDDIIPR